MSDKHFLHESWHRYSYEIFHYKIYILFLDRYTLSLFCRHQLYDFSLLSTTLNCSKLNILPGHFQFYRGILTRASKTFTGASQNLTGASKNLTGAKCPLTRLKVGIAIKKHQKTYVFQRNRQQICIFR